MWPHAVAERTWDDSQVEKQWVPTLAATLRIGPKTLRQTDQWSVCSDQAAKITFWNALTIEEYRCTWKDWPYQPPHIWNQSWDAKVWLYSKGHKGDVTNKLRPAEWNLTDWRRARLETKNWKTFDWTWSAANDEWRAQSISKELAWTEQSKQA